MDTEDLQLFLQEWKDELKEKTATNAQKRSLGDKDKLGKYQHSPEKRTFWEFRCFEEEVTQLNADSVDPLEFLNQKSGKFETSHQIPESKSITNVNESDDTILFSLPLPLDENVQSTFSPGCKLPCGQSNNVDNRKKSLVDQLIEDIDEVTSIPFFDLSLPREVGIQIFSHLDFKDLCACAQVSKSWKILAEDELLWYHVGCQLGYVRRRNCAVVDQENWKAIVQHSMLEERSLGMNWKERICKVSGLEFERGGSLCAVSIHQDLICSGYSSGAVVVWETGDRDNNLSYRELMTPDSQGNKPQVTCTAVNSTLCTAGFNNGDVYTWQSSLSSLPLCHCRCEGAVKSVSLTSDPPAFLAISDHELKVQMSDSNGQWTCIESKNFEDKIGHAMFIPGSSSYSSTEHVAIATQDTVSVLTPGKGVLLTLDQVIGGKLSCMDCTADHLALGVGSFGYGTLGNKVYLYNLETSKMLSILGGHYREITCLDLASCPQHRLVTGSYDCRVRVFDLRSEKVTHSFHLGHKRFVTAVQMDDWKVVSGAEDGTLMVWDQRMTSPLWMTRARHPVRLCKFEGSVMFTANIPLDKTARENLWYADDLILHRRHRGIIRLYDFSAKNSTEGIPEICSSSYDDTTGYNYNIKLSVPYDRIDDR